MKQAAEYHRASLKAQAPAPPKYGAEDTEIIKRLFQSMAANYGGLFLATLDDEKTQQIWERSWLASIDGKSLEYVAKALTYCLDTHNKPFTRADFQLAYKSLRPTAANRRNQLALPRRTKAESREIAERYLTEARGIIGK